MRFQDLKQTPQKPSTFSKKATLFDQSFPKQLLCPFLQTLTVARTYTSQTPIQQEPEYLLSPSPVKKDLFSQLLGTEIRQLSPGSSNQDTSKQENICMSQYSSQQDESIQQSSNFANEVNWSDQNILRKRKRKSTAQIRYLKQELEYEINWPKQKIAKMAQITGLSQSQVYKWCWDQKKKQNKINQQLTKCFDKRKFIRKSFIVEECMKKKYWKLETREEDDDQRKENYREVVNREQWQRSRRTRN